MSVFVLAKLSRGPSCRSATVLEVVGTPAIVAHKVARSMQRARKPRYLFMLPLDARMRVDGARQWTVLEPAK